MSVHNIRTERIQPGDVYVGRKIDRLASRYPGLEGINGFFGNPYVIAYGRTREQSIEEFERFARKRIQVESEYRGRVKGLHGKRLFCWCAPERCHAEILQQIAAEMNAEDAS